MAVGVSGEVPREKLEQIIEIYDDPWTIRKMREKGMVREVKQREGWLKEETKGERVREDERIDLRSSACGREREREVRGEMVKN